jgi:hypothetical protein
MTPVLGIVQKRIKKVKRNRNEILFILSFWKGMLKRILKFIAQTTVIGVMVTQRPKTKCLFDAQFTEPWQQNQPMIQPIDLPGKLPKSCPCAS